MNKLQKTTLALISLWAVVTAGITFADDTPVTTAPPPPTTTGSGEMHRWGWQRDFWYQFIKKDLTDTEKTSLEALKKAHMDEMKTFLDANKWKMSDTAVMEQYLALQKKFLTSLLPYVASDKLDAYNKFIENMKLWQTPPRHEGERTGSGQTNKPERRDDDHRVGSGATDRPEHKNSGSWSIDRRQNDDKEKVWNGRSGDKKEWNQQKTGVTLPASVAQALDNRLATFTDTESKLAWLNGVNAKIDALAAKVTSQKSKDLLNALKNLINSKIDDLNGNSIDSTTITNLLQ